MRTRIFMIIFFIVSPTSIANQLFATFIRMPDGDFKVTITNMGESLILSNPAEVEFSVKFESKGDSAIQIRNNRTNLHWKHLLILLENREDPLIVNTHEFIINKNDIPSYLSLKNKINIIEISLFSSSLVDFQKNGIASLKIRDIAVTKIHDPK